MRHGIVEGEPGSMPWGEWHLLMWIRDHLHRRAGAQGQNPPPSPTSTDAGTGAETGAGADAGTGAGTEAAAEPGPAPHPPTQG